MIVITGGGTGGHLAIAKSFNESLNKLGVKTIFIGSTNGQDMLWFENDEKFSQKHFLQSKGVVNKRGISKILSIFNILKLALNSVKIFRKNRVKAVISVGGYSAAPASIAAIISRTPLFIHEQNAVTGKLNSLLKPLAKGFYSSYEKPFYPYPVANKFYASARIRQNLKTILFMGGSQGAAAINNLAINMANELKQKNIKIIHQCGKNAYYNLKNSYEASGLVLGVDIELFEFSKNMDEILSRADIAISRAGASSLWESVANALPCIFIPYPHAAGNHQFFNANFLKEKALCEIINQNEASAQSVFEILKNLKIAEISAGLKNLTKQSDSELIINEILKNIEGQK